MGLKTLSWLIHFAVSHIVLKGAFSIFPYLPMESRELKGW